MRQRLVEMEGTFPSEQDPTGSFTPIDIANELKVQVGAARDTQFTGCEAYGHITILLLYFG